MNTKHTAYVCSMTAARSDNALAMFHILQDIGHRVEIVVDIQKVSKTTKGKFWPQTTALIEVEGRILKNWHDVAKWIDDTGIRPL
jgi:hypothetical protein